MSMAYIRKTYGVPARRGARVRFAPNTRDARDAIVTGSAGARLRARWADDPAGPAVLLHPTWCVEYLSGAPNAPDQPQNCREVNDDET